MFGLGKYPGGKMRVAERILPRLPIDFDWYVEVFCGNARFWTPSSGIISTPHAGRAG